MKYIILLSTLILFISCSDNTNTSITTHIPEQAQDTNNNFESEPVNNYESGTNFNQENYEKIIQGMSIDEVEMLLGNGEIVQDINAGSTTLKTLSWGYDSMKVTVNFINDKVNVKTILPLK